MTGVQITTSYIGQSTFNGLAPARGPRIVSAALDFSVAPGAKIDVDLTTAQEQDKIEFIQGMYVDNSLNSAPLIVDIRHIGLTETFPPYSQGWLPLPSPNPPKFGFVTTTSIIINVILTSFPVPAEVWQTQALPSPGGTGNDASANEPSLAGLHQIAALSTNPARSLLGYQNQSAVQQYLVFFNGNGTATILVFGSGTGANTQGGSYIDAAYKGVVQVYSTNTTDQCALYER